MQYGGAEWSGMLHYEKCQYSYLGACRCRFGGSELHAVAASVGGLAAHEVIKLLTRQYVPLDNTLIYNAISQNLFILAL